MPARIMRPSPVLVKPRALPPSPMPAPEKVVSICTVRVRALPMSVVAPENTTLPWPLPAALTL